MTMKKIEILELRNYFNTQVKQGMQLQPRLKGNEKYIKLDPYDSNNIEDIFNNLIVEIYEKINGANKINDLEKIMNEKYNNEIYEFAIQKIIYNFIKKDNDNIINSKILVLFQAKILNGVISRSFNNTIFQNIDDEFNIDLSDISNKVKEYLDSTNDNIKNQLLDLNSQDIVLEFIEKVFINNLNSYDKKNEYLIKFYSQDIYSSQLNEKIQCISYNNFIFENVLNKSNINEQDISGYTALMKTVLSKNLIGLIKLLDKKANIIYRNNKNENILDILISQLNF